MLFTHSNISGQDVPEYLIWTFYVTALTTRWCFYPQEVNAFFVIDRLEKNKNN